MMDILITAAGSNPAAYDAAALPGRVVIMSVADEARKIVEGILSRGDDAYVALVDGALLERDPETVRAFLDWACSSRPAFGYLPISDGEEMLDFPALDISSLVPFLNTAEELPSLCVAFTTELFRESNRPSSCDVSEAAMKAFVTATSKGHEISRFPGAATGPAPVAPQAALAAGLKAAIEGNNIEDLFPHHPWREHEAESAAACYHSLAALFLRLGDKASALECLGHGDRLEDSPRSLALKAIIAMDRGETLGAVANIVSSLQQYELRKKEDASHYLKFTPRDLEKINDHLTEGLAALNRRENEKALGLFARAVFSFDSFYADYGLDRLLH